MKVLITFLLTSLAYHVMAVPSVNDDPKIDTSEMNAIPKDKKVSMHTSKGESRLTLIGMSYESKKNAHFYRHLRVFFLRLNELFRVSN